MERHTGLATKRSVLLAATALSALASTPAWAQNSDASATNGADIIVTARRVEERLQDVPISITVFNQTQLDKSNITNGVELASFTPSLTANSRFGQSNASFAIRGFTQELRTAPSVGVYFAEVTAPRAGLVGSYFGEGAGAGLYFDLQNVQVLKGPQGTLFGRNTTGGAIVLVPQRPTDRFEGYVEGTVGNFNLRRVQGAINLPLSDALRLRLGGDYEKRDGYLKNISGIGPSRLGDRDRYALRASVLWDISPDIENYTVAYIQRSSDTGVIPKITECNNSIPINGRIPAMGNQACAQMAREAGQSFWTVQNALVNPDNTARQWQVINQTKWVASDSITVRNIASYGEYKAQFRNATFGEYFPLGGDNPPDASLIFTWSYPIGEPTGPGGLSPGGKLLPRANQWTLSEELQLVGNLPNLEWQAGFYYEKSQSIGLSGANSASFAACPGNPPVIETGTCIPVFGPASAIYSPAINQSKFRDIGAYGQATYSFSDQLKLTGGFRYTWDRVEGENVSAVRRAVNGPFTCTFAPIVGPTIPNPANPNARIGAPITDINECRINPKTSSSAPTWMIDLDYFPIPDMMIYAKYSRGYRQGTVNIFASVGSSFDTIAPEKVDVYEAGLKTSWRGAAPGSFNVAAFYNDFTNQQVLLGLEDRVLNRATATATVVNVGNSTIQGIEADATVRLADAVTLSGNAAYLDTKIKSLTFPTLGPDVPYDTLVATVFPGSALPFTPKWKMTLTAAWDLPLPEDIGKVTLSGTFSYTDKLLNQAGNPDGDPARNIPPGVQRGNGIFVPNIYLPSVSLWNFNLSWNDALQLPVDISAFVVNATNEKYYLSYNNRNSVGFASQLPAEPRTWGVKLRYRFGS
ncbi:TonB-dependent receptor [Novosphingobium album (ex Liu et al. 2023)]|uniref:TonB-dependent receptor n=1 Tax=Novosphingobium album (ex Liu et al. 2023) TaxID=3031130 RepID=A0ABT5WM93_9SPHN|nr:TonB-dependent receptor [Novosphingobium album (ex Liu et al. 2023)]MDE8650999.1 TonB-dependent receptor [Novosphingobium album (ex Liu et al. 2023)]